MKRRILSLLIIFFVSFFWVTVKLNAQERTIADGIYTIHSSVNDNFVLDVNSAKAANNSNIQLYKSNKTNAQKFEIEYGSDGYYTIKSVINKNYVLDINGGNFKDSTNISIYSKNNSDAQKWIIKNVDGYYTFYSKNGAYVMDVAGGKAKNGSNVQIYSSNGTKAQKFRLEKFTTAKKTIEDGVYTIVSSSNENFVLDISAARFNNNSNIQLYENNKTVAQQWIVKYLNNGYYSIKAYFNDSFSLNAQNNGKVKGTNLNLYKYSASYSQQFSIDDMGNGDYNIVSRNNDLAVDILNGVKKNSNNIQLYTINLNEAQRFKFKKSKISSKQIIEDGYYFIASSINSNKVLDVAGGTMENNTNVQIYDINSSLAQKWYIKYNSEGYYSILSDKDNSFALTYSDDSNVFISKNENKDNQKWYVACTENGYYFVTESGLYLDLHYADTKNGSNIDLYSYNGTKAQKFSLKKTVSGLSERILSDGVYNIAVSLNNGVVLDIASASTKNGANIQLYKSNGTKAQGFKVEYMSNGYYKIVSLLDLKKSLDVKGASSTPGANVQLYDFNNSIAQQWIIKDAGDGYYYIVSNSGGLYLDAAGGKTANGTNINVYTKNGSGAQKFRFKKVSDGVRVIDISAHNTITDWDKIANSDIYGVILRVGAWTSEDAKFSTFLKEIQKRNIPYGIYLFSYANLTSHAQEEADFVNKAMSYYKLNPTLGIYYDLEPWTSSNGTHSGMITKELYDDISRTFINSVSSKNRGYSVKIYASTDYVNTRFKEYARSNVAWIAQWSNKCTYTGKYILWQYTNKGSVPGINGRVDISYYYG